MPEIVCYCLQSSVSNRTYIGATVDHHRRIRQHNGVIKGGAKYTSKYRPWDAKILVKGFGTWKEALQFEWRWKHVRHPRKGITPLERRKRCLERLLTWKPWNELEKALVVEFTD